MGSCDGSNWKSQRRSSTFCPAATTQDVLDQRPQAFCSIGVSLGTNAIAEASRQTTNIQKSDPTGADQSQLAIGSERAYHGGPKMKVRIHLAGIFGGFLFAVISSCGIPVFGQSNPALEPNPSCPGSAPYCRAITFPPLTEFGALGFSNGVLYGGMVVSAGSSCPGAVPLPLSPSYPTICLYTATSFAPENWAFQGQFPIPDTPIPVESPLEMVFGTGSCSNYKYLEINGPHIYRATSDPTDWNFTDLVYPQISGVPFSQYGFGILQTPPQTPTLPQLPPPVTAPGGSPPQFSFFSSVLRRGLMFGGNTQGGTRLFYGNYPSNNSTYTTGTCKADPNACPHAYIWHSADCGNPWSTPSEIGASQGLHAQEVHALNVDPLNSSTIYAMIDDENADEGTHGLWESADCGITFTQLDPGDPNVGIDFVLPSGPGIASNLVVAETDRLLGGSLLSFNPAYPVGGPVFQVAGNYPQPAPNPPYLGSGFGMVLTTENNIFVINDIEGHPRSGAWYVAPPNYDSATLLENHAVPISSIAYNNSLFTVTTAEPHGILSGNPGGLN